MENILRPMENHWGSLNKNNGKLLIHQSACVSRIIEFELCFAQGERN